MDLQTYALLNKKIQNIKGKDGKSAYEVAIENGFVGTEEEWLQSLKGAKGDQGDNGVFVGDVSEAPPTAHIIVDDSDDGLFFECEGATIDDSTIALDKTWSSSKIEDFVLNNDNAVWLDTSGENLKIDSTKEGYLREIEVWGNTIQNEEDLSDIQHLGELYVDGEGRPILDDLGREQYKIEIDSANYYNSKTVYTGVNVQPIEVEYPISRNTIFTIELILNNITDGKIFEIGSNFNTSLFIEGGNIKLKNFNTDAGELTKDLGKADIDSVYSIVYNGNRFEVYINGVYTNYIGWIFATSKTISILNNLKFLKINSVAINADNLLKNQPQSHKRTILLPCQLMKVGDVADRLYWDSEKGKYVVEKNTRQYLIKGNEFSTDLNTNSSWKKDNTYRHRTSSPLFSDYKPSTDSQETVNNLSTLSQAVTYNELLDNDVEGIASSNKYNNQVFVLSILKSKISTTISDYFASNLTYIYYPCDSYFIETNITEQIKLPTYLNTTYITVNGGIQGSIKTKSPIDSSAVVNSLVQENKELKIANEELKVVNDEQDEIINISLMATDEIFTMLEPLLDVAVLSNENSSSKLASMYEIMIRKGLKKIEEIPERYRLEIEKEGE